MENSIIVIKIPQQLFPQIIEGLLLWVPHSVVEVILRGSWWREVANLCSSATLYDLLRCAIMALIKEEETINNNCWWQSSFDKALWKNIFFCDGLLGASCDIISGLRVHTKALSFVCHLFSILYCKQSSRRVRRSDDVGSFRRPKPSAETRVRDIGSSSKLPTSVDQVSRKTFALLMMLTTL